MNILIAYATKTGTVEICAKKLAEAFPSHKVSLVNLSDSQPNALEFDFIVVGGSIRMGKLHKAAYKFIEKNLDKIKGKKSAYFICNGLPDNTDKYLKNAFPRGTSDTAVLLDSFGGELKPDKQRGIDKFIVKSILNSSKANEDSEFVIPTISTESIGRFADKIKENL